MRMKFYYKLILFYDVMNLYCNKLQKTNRVKFDLEQKINNKSENENLISFVLWTHLLGYSFKFKVTAFPGQFHQLYV